MTGRNIPSFSRWLAGKIKEWLSPNNIAFLLVIIFMITGVASIAAVSLGLAYNDLQFKIYGATGVVVSSMSLLYMNYLNEHDIIDL